MRYYFVMRSLIIFLVSMLKLYQYMHLNSCAYERAQELTAAKLRKLLKHASIYITPG